MAQVRYPSPCLICCRVKDPMSCDNKNCVQWQQWFIGRWEATRKQLLSQLDRLPSPPKGVNIGGRRYILPHQIREYLQYDPCAGCSKRGKDCAASCQLRQDWEQTRNEVLL